MTTQFCTFQVDGQLFGVEVSQIVEVLRRTHLTSVPRSRPEVAGLMNLRGQIICALDLRTILGLAPLAQGVSLNLVIRVGEETVSLLVDEIDDVLDLVEQSFEPVPGGLPAAVRQVVTGTYKLEKRLLLVLDVVAAIATKRTGALTAVAS
jgi:purine-binding chemotaxis protein CheW